MQGPLVIWHFYKCRNHAVFLCQFLNFLLALKLWLILDFYLLQPRNGGCDVGKWEAEYEKFLQNNWQDVQDQSVGSSPI